VNPSLYLASQSPRRRELLTQIGVDFQTLTVEVTEQRLADELPAEYVQRLAADKAKAGGELLLEMASVTSSVGDYLPVSSTIPVLGSDTVVVLGDQVLEKPADEAEAVTMLLALSGRPHQVMTAVSFYTPERQQTMLSVTDVVFREITELEAHRYWQTGEPCDKAGGYGIQGLGAVFVTEIHGSYTGVVGLPLEQTYLLLDSFGIAYWQ
jgi:nucleoside triphosphate pyrophosphatase